MATKQCCDKLTYCPFFKSVKESAEVSDVLNDYLNVYCCGPFKEKCYRLHHLAQYGEPPNDFIAPSGLDFRNYV